jgi:hypothetical protein
VISRAIKEKSLTAEHAEIAARKTEQEKESEVKREIQRAARGELGENREEVNALLIRRLRSAGSAVQLSISAMTH